VQFDRLSGAPRTRRYIHAEARARDDRRRWLLICAAVGLSSANLGSMVGGHGRDEGSLWCARALRPAHRQTRRHLTGPTPDKGAIVRIAGAAQSRSARCHEPSPGIRVIADRHTRPVSPHAHWPYRRFPDRAIGRAGHWWPAVAWWREVLAARGNLGRRLAAQASDLRPSGLWPFWEDCPVRVEV
jgi:hypothetical protein